MCKSVRWVTPTSKGSRQAAGSPTVRASKIAAPKVPGADASSHKRHEAKTVTVPRTTVRCAADRRNHWVLRSSHS